MKKPLVLALGLSLACSVLAQPFVLECNLNYETVRNNIVEKEKTGLWCRSCRVAITVVDNKYLYIDGVTPPFLILYDTKNKVDLDSYGYGYEGTWSITQSGIEGSYRHYVRNKQNGSVSFSINRLTGRVSGYSIEKNPIGSGDFVTTTDGECKAAKPIF